MWADGKSRNVQVLGQDGFDLGIKGPVLCLKGGAISFSRVIIDKIFRSFNGGKSSG